MAKEKEEELYCPIKFASRLPLQEGLCCSKEKCTWWHILNIQTKKGRCSLLTLAVALHWISVNPKHHVMEVKDG